MTEPVSTTFSLAELSKLMIIPVIGALAHALDSVRTGKTKSLRDFFILSFISGFSGLMFLLLALAAAPNNIYVIGLVAGAGGWLGVEGMATITNFVKRTIEANFTSKK
jgi:hypothetical protein